MPSEYRVSVCEQSECKSSAMSASAVTSEWKQFEHNQSTPMHACSEYEQSESIFEHMIDLHIHHLGKQSVQHFWVLLSVPLTVEFLSSCS